VDTDYLSGVLDGLRDLARSLGGALVSHLVASRSQFERLSLGKRFVTSCLSFEAKLNSGVAVEGSLAIGNETSDGVRVTKISVLVFVLSLEVSGIVTSLGLFLH
jgi:hypothetical protein